MSIKLFIVQNKQGKTRFEKWWIDWNDSESVTDANADYQTTTSTSTNDLKNHWKTQIYKHISLADYSLGGISNHAHFKKKQKNSNFISIELPTVSSASTSTHPHKSNFMRLKLVYKRYAALYFILGVEDLDYSEPSTISNSQNHQQVCVTPPQPNPLALLELIHWVVELIDSYFPENNVCELDLVFNFWKINQLLDEVFMSGGWWQIGSGGSAVGSKKYSMAMNNLPSPVTKSGYLSQAQLSNFPEQAQIVKRVRWLMNDDNE